jgi:hypothetical protein
MNETLVISVTILLLSIATGFVSGALYVFISTGSWVWRHILALTFSIAVVVFVLLTNGVGLVE